MAAKKGKKKIKVHDLKPKKDAKGGFEPNISFSGPKGSGPAGPAGPLGGGNYGKTGGGN